MSYADLQHLSDSEFKRLCGVSRDTFTQMVEVLCPHLEREGQRGGQNESSTQDQLLVTLFVLNAIADSTKAIKTQAIKLKPDYTLAYASRGDAHSMTKEYTKAIAGYNS